MEERVIVFNKKCPVCSKLIAENSIYCSHKCYLEDNKKNKVGVKNDS